MKLQVFVELTHFQVLLFVGKSSFLTLSEVIIEVVLCIQQLLVFLFASDELLADIFKLQFKVVESFHLMFLNQIEIVF